MFVIIEAMIVGETTNLEVQEQMLRLYVGLMS